MIIKQNKIRSRIKLIFTPIYGKPMKVINIVPRMQPAVEKHSISLAETLCSLFSIIRVGMTADEIAMAGTYGRIYKEPIRTKKKGE